MSNIYIQEPPSSGKVVLKTSIGDIDVELWTKEAPKACRNFIQLCMEGYYDNTIFHRVVKGFIVQGGDPTGTGNGGESIYGEAFKDEFHTRLRFNRRGLVAMANAGKDDNGSQFFFTLGATPELQNKHTIFGKVAGETIFNMIKLEDAMVDKDDRPIYPQKILKTEVLSNPFGDIIPRTIKKVVKEKKEKVEKEKVKNFKLLSFGEEAEEDEELSVNLNKHYKGKNKGMSAHDNIADPKLSSETFNINEDITPENSKNDSAKEEDDDDSDTELRKDNDDKDDISSEDEIPHEISEKEKRREEIKQEIKNLKRDVRRSNKEKEIKENEEDIKEEKRSSKSELFNEMMEIREAYKESTVRLSRKDPARQDLTLKILSKFRSKVRNTDLVEEEDKKEEEETEEDNDSYLGCTLHCTEQAPVLAKDANRKDDEWFDIYDPRNPINKRRRGEKPNDNAKDKRARK